MSTPAGHWINATIDVALSRAFDKIDKFQRDGHCTEEDVKQTLYDGWGDMIGDSWREYIGEGD